MTQIEPLQMMKNSELADKAFQLMPEDSRKAVVNWTLIRQGSRYKGGYHNLQSLGIMTGVFPDILRSFNECRARNKELEIENEVLKAKIARLESNGSCLEKENDLLRRAREERQEVQVSAQGVPQFLIKLASMIMKERKLAFDYSAMWELLCVTYKGFNRDLLQVLYIVLSSRMSFDEVRKILEMIYNHHKEGFAMVKIIGAEP